MATITKRPSSYTSDGTDWKNISNVYDTSTTTYMYNSNKSGTLVRIMLFYDFSDLPAGAVISGVSVACKYTATKSLNYRLVSDASSVMDYTDLCGEYYTVHSGATETSETKTETFSSDSTLVAALNNDIDILRGNRFALRMAGQNNVTSGRQYIYDIPITITYTVRHTITTSVTPSGGGTVSGAGTYNNGASATLMATPSDGYRFVKWQKNGADDGSTSATRTVTVTADATYTAVFALNTVTVSFNASGGSVSTASKDVTPGGTYGTLPTPTRAGYTFTGWYTRQPVYNGGYLRNNGSVALGRTYMYTDKISVKIWAYENNWGDISNKNLISCTEGGGWGIGYLANTTGHGTEIYIAGQGYKGIDFGIASLSSGWHCFDMVFDGGTFTGYVDGVLKGSVNTGGTSISYHSSNGIFIGAEAGSSATTAGGGYFNGSLGSVIISNDGARLAEVTSGTTVTDQSSHTLYAGWRINHYTTSATCSNGTVNGATSWSSENPYGEQIVLTATPATGYHFSQWNDGNTSSSRTVTVQSGAAYTAYFVINTYNIARTLSHVTMSNSAVTAQHGSSYTSSLTADSGYEIDSVTVTMGGADITGTAYSDGYVSIASVTGNIAVTASATVVRLPEIVSVSIVPNPVNAGQGYVLTVVMS